jgi:hypothetical protein
VNICRRTPPPHHGTPTTVLPGRDAVVQRSWRALWFPANHAYWIVQDDHNDNDLLLGPGAHLSAYLSQTRLWWEDLSTSAKWSAGMPAFAAIRVPSWCHNKSPEPIAELMRTRLSQINLPELLTKVRDGDI